MRIFDRELQDHIPICNGWLEPKHYLKHWEILGPTETGKSTLVQWFMLELLERQEAGILYVDPTGRGYQRMLGWLAEGAIQRPCYVVDLERYFPKYNPLDIDTRDGVKVGRHIEGLFEVLSLIKSDAPLGQHQQMQRFVTATLRALIECNLTLAHAYKWLTDEAWRRQQINHYMQRKGVSRNNNPEWLDEWIQEPSRSDLRSTLNWFAVFWSDALKSMYNGNGFTWEKVYDEQPLVLVNLASVSDSLRYSKAIGSLFLTGLITHGRHTKQPRLWYAIVDDATDYVPNHVGQIINIARHAGVYLILIHHVAFDGKLQGRVNHGCRTKFFFGPIAKENQWEIESPYDTEIIQREVVELPDGTRQYHSRRIQSSKPAAGPTHLPAFQCLHVFDGHNVQTIELEPTPEPEGDGEEWLDQVGRFRDHPWYQHAKDGGKEADEPHQKSQGSGPRKSSRGK